MNQRVIVAVVIIVNMTTGLPFARPVGAADVNKTADKTKAADPTNAAFKNKAAVTIKSADTHKKRSSPGSTKKPGGKGKVEIEDKVLAKNATKEPISTKFKASCDEIDKLLDQKKYDEALKKADDLVKKFPTEMAPYFKRAHVEIYLKMTESGLRDIRKAMAIGPTTAAAYAVKSRLFLQKGDLPNALASIDLSLKLRPEKKNARILRATILEAMGRESEAESEIETAGNQPPSLGKPNQSYNVAMTSARFYQKRNPEVALSHLKYAIREQPRNPEPWILTAAIRTKQKDYVQAIRALDAAIKLDPKNANLYFERARLNKTTLMAQEGITDCDRAIMRDGTVARYYRLRSELSAQLGRLEGALVDAEKSIALDPFEPANYSAKADVLNLMKRYAECVKVCAAGLKNKPNSISLLISRGEAYEKLGKKELALKDYQLAASSGQHLSFRNLVRKGTLESELGKNEDAIKTYTAAINKAKSTAKSRAYIERAEIYERVGKKLEAQADRKQAKELSSSFMDDIIGD